MVVAAAVAAGAAITGAVVLTGTESSEPGAETRPVPADDAFSIEQHRGPYRIVYRVEDPSGDAGVQTERVWVRSPFESRSETAAGAPPGGEVVSVQIATVDRLRFGGRDDAATVARVPGLAPAAVRVAVILDEAEDAGLVEAREQRVVADRRCQVYRSGTLLGSGPLEPITDDGHADSCVDEDGLVLEETLVVDGEAVVRRVAVEVELGDVDADLFDPGEISATVEQGGGAATPADPASAPEGPFHRLPADEIPEGFELQGRFSVIPPQPERFSDPLLGDQIVAGVADVYVDGRGDAFVVYQGGTFGRVDAFAPEPTAEVVRHPTFGRGELLLSAAGTELRFALDDGRFVHVVGTIEPDRLERIAGALEEIQGTGLVLLDG